MKCEGDGVTDNASSGRGASFGYTDAGRLNAATGPWGADAYTGTMRICGVLRDEWKGAR